MRTKIVILGDLYPNNIKEFPSLPDNDFCVANLECAITDCQNAIKKDGPSLKIPPKDIEKLSLLGVDLVGLANNHVFDYGIEGFEDTLRYLNNAGICFSGHSNNSFFKKEINGKKIAFYFVSEHQYNYFSKKEIGVNVLELDCCFKEIENLKKTSDVVFVMFHGGKEYYEFPTPLQQDTCHKFVDSGADVVLCQHSHCVGCEEKYRNSTILYGQGNFAFPYSNNKHFQNGFVVSATIDNNNSVCLEYIPIIHERPGIIEFASTHKSKEIMDAFNTRSKELADKSAELLYDQYVDKFGLDFLYRLFNKGKLYVRLDTSRFFKNKMLKRYLRKNQKNLLYLYNYFNCETHVEYIKAILKKQIDTGK